MLFLQLPPVHSSSTARPPDPDLRSRSSISSLLPCYFWSSRPSTARPPPVHRILTFDLAPPAMLFLQLPPVHSLSTARPPDPDLQSRSSISSLLPCYFCSSRPSTARPPPVHRILTMLFLQLPPVHSSSTARPPDHPLQSRSSISSLLPCYFCSSRRPQPVHRPSTGSWPSISLLHL